MSFSLSKLIRPNVLRMKPYSSARDEYKGTEGVFLDANENSLGSTISISVNRYPDPLQKQVKQAICLLKGIPEEQIFLGNGSDEPIDLILRALCEPGKDAIVIMPPTYGMYEVSAHLNDVKIIEVPLNSDYQIRKEAVLQSIDSSVKVIFCCSPNNPTGNLLSTKDILEIASQFDGIVVVDEAYIDFASMPSITTYISEYPNILVLQTFSKAWGLAALRLGMAFGTKELIQVLNKIKPPYNINQLTQEKAVEALSNVAQMQAMVKEIVGQREWLRKELEQLPFIHFIAPSEANFLLIKTVDGTDLYEYLVRHQIITRNRSTVLLCEQGVRITVGTKDENKQLISVLQSYSIPAIK
ncbi:MAG: histidinol-phosphate transaminase [Cytophagaceae bacterium]|jgi:histidinol-phosphate aminotransferase|nr:histidinol-phosphate transaminase [Cytophagaceae bacterium]